MAKGKKPATATLHEHDYGDATETSVVQISQDFRRRRVRSRPARVVVPLSPPLPTSDAYDQDLPPLDLSEFQESISVAITDQIEGITVVAKQKAKRYENSVSLPPTIDLLPA